MMSMMSLTNFVCKIKFCQRKFNKKISPLNHITSLINFVKNNLILTKLIHLLDTFEKSFFSSDFCRQKSFLLTKLYGDSYGWKT